MLFRLIQYLCETLFNIRKTSQFSLATKSLKALYYVAMLPHAARKSFANFHARV